jgi:CheY-like chemotaxis protein
MASILFIDDDPVTLEILGKAARILGHTPTLANEARPAIQTAATLKPDLIMMDMMMPDMDGLDVLAALRAQPLTMNVPVVILSAGASPDDARLARAAGAQEYMNKPVSLAALVDTIKKYTTPK